MKRLRLFFLALGFCFGLNPAAAEVRQIHALETARKQLLAVKDSLEAERTRVMESADVLSARIDSFKAGKIDTPNFRDALRSSVTLEQRLMEIDRQLEALHADQNLSRDHLRLAYDWEIGALIQQLAQTPDQGLLQQLVIYQQARETLGDEVDRRSLRFGDNMDIGAEDGPDEIGQKVDLMEDIADRLQAESTENADRLSRLEEEHRLRSRVRFFATEIQLFDEHLPEGRVLVRVERSNVKSTDEVLSGGEDASLEPGADAPFESNDVFSADEGGSRVSGSQEVLIAQNELSREPLSVGYLVAEDIALEIRKLKVRQQEIRQLESVARERAAAFRARLRELLEGE